MKSLFVRKDRGNGKVFVPEDKVEGLRQSNMDEDEIIQGHTVNFKVHEIL